MSVRAAAAHASVLLYESMLVEDDDEEDIVAISERLSTESLDEVRCEADAHTRKGGMRRLVHGRVDRV